MLDGFIVAVLESDGFIVAVLEGDRHPSPEAADGYLAVLHAHLLPALAAAGRNPDLEG